MQASSFCKSVVKRQNARPHRIVLISLNNWMRTKLKVLENRMKDFKPCRKLLSTSMVRILLFDDDFCKSSCTVRFLWGTRDSFALFIFRSVSSIEAPVLVWNAFMFTWAMIPFFQYRPIHLSWLFNKKKEAYHLPYNVPIGLHEWFFRIPGPVQGPQKMQHIVDKTRDVMNSFIKAIEELAILRENLARTEVNIVNWEYSSNTHRKSLKNLAGFGSKWES